MDEGPKKRIPPAITPPAWSGRVVREPPPGKIRPRRKVEEVFDVGARWVLELQTATKPLDLAALFGNDRPVALEIGPGGGEFLLGMAALYPDLNFMAIEMKAYRVAKVAKKLERSGLTNARLIWAEAGGVLPEFLAPNSLSALYVNFPDPWSKRKHRRRRLVQQPFIDDLKSVLKPGGEFTFVSDVRNYAEEVIQLAEKNGFANVFGPGVMIDRIDGYIPTVFEARWRAEGRSIHSTRFHKLPM